jgi:hypothetical protein
MTEKSERKELERRLEQARRILREQNDSLTQGRLRTLVRDLEQQLRYPSDGLMSVSMISGSTASAAPKPRDECRDRAASHLVAEWAAVGRSLWHPWGSTAPLSCPPKKSPALEVAGPK